MTPRNKAKLDATLQDLLFECQELQKAIDLEDFESAVDTLGDVTSVVEHCQDRLNFDSEKEAK